jgi:predicted lysophospholipase L1 biosynthesis ABC-type transport system permease subunit
MLRQLERIGIAASVICGIHCLLTPILVVAAPSISGHFSQDPMLEQVLIGFSVLSSIVVLGYDYLKIHHNLQPILIALVAWVMTIGSHLMPVSETVHQILAIAGGLLVGLAFVRNWIIRRTHHSCATHSAS